MSSSFERYRADDLPLFLIGTFDTGVTVLSQQIRALNLAHSLVEAELITCDQSKPKQKIAIVGGGFAGLTLAAALVEKEVHAEVSIFEQRDTLMPLQQGSDSRWLHPRIYDWPRDGSEASAAMLPVLNWTAARASDVVVQILAQWKNVASKHPCLKVYCNARHVQVDLAEGDKLAIEWTGERREVDGNKRAGEEAQGSVELFDAVILAIGFGLERESEPPYWRNETFSQPSLDQPRKTFLVAGQGDGALIDLFRLRISQYRQDRILDEIFSGVKDLRVALSDLRSRYDTNPSRVRFFEELERLGTDKSCAKQVKVVIDALRSRLRRDTDVILRLSNPSISVLFDRERRISFQNRVLAYFLYKCGGFVPSSVCVKDLMSSHAIPDTQVIRRFGPDPKALLRSVVSASIFDRILPNPAKPQRKMQQSDLIGWKGGYFGYPRPTKDIDLVKDPERREWRKEYLPGPTSLIGASLSASIAGVIRSRTKKVGRLRVTLHRTIMVGEEEFLQQTCDYVGSDIASDQNHTAGRTFQNYAATIGQAYLCRKIIRSKPNVELETLRECMARLRLHTSARSMSKEVSFVLALPILEPNSNYSRKSPVAGVIYIDSTEPGFYVDDDLLSDLASIAQQVLDELERSPSFDRVRNDLLSVVSVEPPANAILSNFAKDALDLIESVVPPTSSKPFQFNHDYSDFTTAR